MPKSKQRRHGRRPPNERPYLSMIELRQRLQEKLTLQELDTLEKQIRKAVELSIADAVNACYQRHWAVVMRVLRDRFGWGSVRLHRLWDQCLSYLDDIEDGSLDAKEILDSLYEEDGIRILWMYKPEDKDADTNTKEEKENA